MNVNNHLLVCHHARVQFEPQNLCINLNSLIDFRVSSCHVDFINFFSTHVHGLIVCDPLLIVCPKKQTIV